MQCDIEVLEISLGLAGQKLQKKHVERKKNIYMILSVTIRYDDWTDGW